MRRKGAVAVLLALFLTLHAHAMDSAGFRPSANVQDRSYEDDFPTQPLELLKKLEPLAEAGKMPFLCPALKPVAQKFAAFAKKLGDTKTPRALKDDFDSQVKDFPTSPAHDVTSSGEACEGSKQHVLELDNNAEAKVMLHHGHLMDLHQGLVSDAHAIAQAIDQRLAKPSIRDTFPNQMTDCPGYTLKVREALVQYLKQVSGLSSFYLSLIQGLHSQEDAMNAIQCGEAVAPKSLKSRHK